MHFITVRHNIEVAHRLSELEGKCENVHGHSMWVSLSIQPRNPNMIDPRSGMFLEFGEVKAAFRKHLDVNYDHHLLLNSDDPLMNGYVNIPGSVSMGEGDPTTENIAKWIYDWALEGWGEEYEYRVEVQETSVNFATYGDF